MTRPYAKSGGSFPHVQIVQNLSTSLHSALRNRPCVVLSSDLRVRSSPAGLYTYPDVIVICDSRKFADERQDTLVNPTILIEVLVPFHRSL
ncbi:MAG TPA: Uma2 family endonuclease [Bryobacteraceae bacterium]|nr:Uma2 family endonuclease [Bryobacteraceae bacterium]